MSIFLFDAFMIFVSFIRLVVESITRHIIIHLSFDVQRFLPFPFLLILACFFAVSPVFGDAMDET